MLDSPADDVPLMTTRTELLGAISDAGFGNLIVENIEHPEGMIWYREFISRSESHPRNKSRVIRGLLTGIDANKVDQREIFAGYKRDYYNFYDGGYFCIAQIALKSGPLFVRFQSHERPRFQELFGVIPEEMFDVSNLNDIILYAVPSQGDPSFMNITLQIVKAAGEQDFVVLNVTQEESMIWYRDFISKSASHPRNESRVISYILTSVGIDEKEREEKIAAYKKDYRSFYESGKACIVRIALKSGPLFVQFGSHKIQEFQTLVGVIPDSLFDDSDPHDIFLYSMSEIA